MPVIPSENFDSLSTENNSEENTQVFSELIPTDDFFDDTLGIEAAETLSDESPEVTSTPPPEQSVPHQPIPQKNNNDPIHDERNGTETPLQLQNIPANKTPGTNEYEY